MGSKNKEKQKEKENQKKQIQQTQLQDNSQHQKDFKQKKDFKQNNNKKNLKEFKKNKNNKQDLSKEQTNSTKNKKIQIQNQEQNTNQTQKNNDSDSENDNTIKYPYIVDKEDHCESPLEAYQDISIILLEIAKQLGKNSQELKIYDPYYCQGRVKENFKQVGFTKVYNKKEDFYKVIENNALPEYDVLVTNPPYSEDHIQKIYEFCVKQKKPWFILAPNYCYIKDWYIPTLQKSEPWCKPFYLIPDQRYFYLKEGKKTSPFLSMWYIYLPEKSNEILENCREKLKKYRSLQIIKNIHKIPDNYKDSNDPSRKKLRKNQRKNKQNHKK